MAASVRATALIAATATTLGSAVVVVAVAHGTRREHAALARHLRGLRREVVDLRLELRDEVRDARRALELSEAPAHDRAAGI